MINALDRQKNFLRPGFTLTSALEAFLDPLVTILSLLACLALFDQPVSARYTILGVIAFSLSFPGNVGFHEKPRRMLRKVCTNWLVFLVIMVGFGLATGYLRTFTRPVLVAWAIVTPFAQIGAHFLLRWAMPKAIAKNAQPRKVVITGLNEVGLRLLREFESNPYLNTQVMGFFDDRSSDRLSDLGKVPMLGRMADLAAYMNDNDVEAIYLALPMASQPRILTLLDELKDTTASIYFVPDIFMTDLIQGRLTNVGPMPVMAVCETPFNGTSGLVKRASDIVISLLVLVLGAPIFLLLALAVKFTSPGPVIFKQRRYGLDGKEILVYKFRSMRVCEDGETIHQAKKGDSRITRIGAFLRKSSLDELPQFINVLQGRMSIVGPRPHAVAHNEIYRNLIKGYMIRHKVKPGITGWAQVNGYRGETRTLDKMEARIDHDLDYLRNWSLRLDLHIILKTVIVVFRDRAAY